jgi:hypothetical protein
MAEMRLLMSTSALPNVVVLFFCCPTKVRMYVSQLVSIGLFTAAVVLTLYSISDRMKASRSEGFENPPSVPTIVVNTALIQIPENPTDAEAVAAHQTLLRYTSQNLENGLRFMMAIGNQFFEPPFALRTDLDPSTLLNNYISPLQKV